MTEALISNLTQIHALSRVISRRSVMQYKGSQKSLPEIARELNVDAVIEGSVQRSGGRIHVTARLIPAATDSPVWSRDYDRDLSDVLKLESELARAVTDEIRIQVTPEESARLALARRIDPAAHEAYLLGHYYALKFNEEDFKRAIEYLERAIRLEPDYAAAYAELSEAWRARGVLGSKSFREVEAPALAAALKAIELDPNLAEGHLSLGNLKYVYDWDWSGAEEEMKRAVALDPNSWFAHAAYAGLLMALGRFPEAITHQQIAAQLDPTSSLNRGDLGRTFYWAGKYDEAIENLKRALEMNSQDDLAYSTLAGVYDQIGRYDEALAALDKAQALRPNFWLYRAQRAGLYARAGRRSEALWMIEEFRATTGPARFPEIGLAQVYSALGEKDEAFRLLMKVIEERNQFLSWIKTDPTFKSLHSDPRWNEVLRRMNFPPE
jgi:tetratricopeptide (TPR) repeat protein